MKFSLAWLTQYLETDATAAEIAAKLNALGIEVEGLEDPAKKLAGFRVARVLTAAPHPNADKLQVLTVDNGQGEPLQVVCGAPNARAGLVGVLGTAGAVVPAGGFELKKSAIRGVESNGMMCSARELELGEDHAGIIELPEDAPVGARYVCGTGTALDGATIAGILAVANTALGGGALPASMTFATLNDLITDLNEAFDNGTPTGWANTHLKTQACQ